MKTNMIIPALVALLVVLFLETLKRLWFKPKRIEKLLRQQGLAGNAYKPVIGDLKEFITLAKDSLATPIDFDDDHLRRVVPFIYHTIRKHGKDPFAWIGPTPWLIITDPLKIRDVFVRHEDFRKPNHPFTQLILVGLFGHEGEEWAKHRKIVNPAFNKEKLKNMIEPVNQSCSTMISAWEELTSKEGLAEVDVWPFLECLSGDVISRAAFGSSYEQGQKIFLLQTEHVKLWMQNVQAASTYIPGWRFLPTKVNRRVKEIGQEVEGLLRRLIESRKRELEEGGENKDDLLGKLLESNLREIEENGNEKTKGLTTEEVIQECKLFYLAGSDTTTTSLAWTLILLSKHQIWQKRARAEVLHVFGKDGIPDYQSMSNLNVVSAIIHEVLRLYPPGYMLIRKVYKDTQLRELFVPAETEVVLPLSIIHQDTSLWGNDAMVFNPGRFSEGVLRATKGQPIYYPFSAGPRICIGQNFALLGAKVALCMILQRFALDVSPNYIHAPYATFTMRPQYGAKLILRKLVKR